ncbi:hypothetical protein MMC15_005592 [Xylographa vitiligo]|nr:hypothetical protein [Xylographa vitiligo]
MEPPLKRQRLGNSPEQLLQKRARNDLRLKSRFESIFEKFGKDFTGVGDEIDFQTGKIVVNNGHLTTMQGELDAEGLANEEDELATDTPPKLNSSQLYGHNGGILTKPKEDEDNAAQIVQEGPYGPEVACIGSSIAAAIKMEDGSSYDSSVHGKLFIARNILSQLSCLGPHIRKSIANVQRSANTSKVVSVETEDLTVDPTWRVPVLLHPKLSTPSEEPCERPEPVLEEPQLDSPERSPSPVGKSLWSLDRPVSRSSPFEIVGARDSKDNRTLLRKGRRPPRWTLKEDKMLRKLRSTTKLTDQELETHLPGRADKDLEQRRHSMKMNVTEDAQCTFATSSIPCASLPKTTKPEVPAPIIGSISNAVNIQISPNTNTNVEVINSAIQRLPGHKNQNIKEGKHERAEHARRAYRKTCEWCYVCLSIARLLQLAALEKTSKRSEIPDIQKSDINYLQVSDNNAQKLEQRTSRRTKKAKKVEIRKSAISQEPPTDVSLTEISIEPTSSRISGRIKASKAIIQMPRARRSRKTQSPLSPAFTVSKSLNGTQPAVDRLLKSLLADIDSENNQRFPDVCELSSRDNKSDRNNQIGRHEMGKMSSKEVCVVIVRQDHNNDQSLTNIVEDQASEALFRSTQPESLNHASSPQARRGRPRRNWTGSQQHIGLKSSPRNHEIQPEPHSEKASLRTERGYNPASVCALSHEHQNRNSKMEKSRNDLSSSPDLASTTTPQSRENLKVLSSSKPLGESVSRKLRGKSVSGQRNAKPVPTADSPSLPSILGEFSDDELSHTRKRGKSSLTTIPTTLPLSARTRRCGLPGYKCGRTLCLTCN